MTPHRIHSRTGHSEPGHIHKNLHFRATEQQFREIADSIPQIVWAARPDGYTDYYNKQWYEFSGFPRHRTTERSWMSILHPEDAERGRDTWYDSVKTGHRYEAEYRLWDRGPERYRWFLGRALPVQNTAGQITRWFGTSTDIDEQKRLAEGLLQANEGLQQFAYSAGHDLQEPLRMIAIYSQLLGRKLEGSNDAEIVEFLSNTIQGARRMEALVRDLLAYAEAGALGGDDLEATLSGSAFEAAVENLRLPIEESGARVVAGDLPVVRARRVHVVQLFQNLIGNAIKYRGSSLPDIRVSACRHAVHWEFTVADNGIGIEREYQAQIFGVFKRLHTNGSYPGTGIGLAICKKIAERYQGRIWVDSVPGEGSQFHFTLPAASVTEADGGICP